MTTDTLPLAAAPDREAGLPGPIVVLAPPALPGPSLAAALGRNPDAYGLPEINLPLTGTVEAFLREMPGPRVLQSHGVLRAIAQLYGGEQSLHAVEMARRWLDRRGWMDTGAVTRELLGRVAPQRAVLPATALLFDGMAMRRLIAALPEARFVVLRAHPRIFGRLALTDQAGRIALQLTGALDESFEPALPEPQHLWLRTEEALEKSLGGLPEARVVDLRAEALLRDPEAALRDLARRLKLKWNKAAVARMLAPEASVYAGAGPMGAHADGQIRPFAALAEALPGPEEETLEGPLPWRPDDAGFTEALRRRAAALGLGDEDQNR